MVLTALLAGPALAGEHGVKVYEPMSGGTENQGQDGNAEPTAIEVQTRVPQGAIDYRDKRIEARMRRDEALKVRAATIEQEKAAEQQGQQ